MEKTLDMKKICLLCMLSTKPMHGYDMMKELEARTGKKAGPGYIYPVLNEMQKKGFLKVKSESTGERERKVYSLTERGKKACVDERACIKKTFKEFF
ncbi:MAG: PadR family transcriptional regulator [Candidatus Aenigmarchaeota archaeon]|nr:PadR family transcriptional regulator [Candidatus Aenigmarchaeota archaeon]